MRILGFCDYFGFATSGGAERVSAEVASRLGSFGMDVMMIGAHPKLEAGRAHPESDVTTEIVRGRDLSRWVGAQVMVAPGLHRHASRCLRKHDPAVLYAAGLHFHSSAVAARLARSTGVPLILHAHLGPIGDLPLRLRIPTSVYERSMGRFLVRTAAHVIAVSEAVRDHVVHLGADPQTVTVVANGVDPHRFTPGDPERAPERGDREIVFVGRLIANKGPRELLAAFGRLTHDDATLTFVGDGPLRRRLEEEVIARGMSGRVGFAGEVDDVRPFLRRAALMVRPSQTEGQSLAILEAMACGVCVVASDIAPNREVIADETTGALVPVGDEVALAERIGALLANPGHCRELGAQGRASILGQDWDRCARATARVVQSVAGNVDS
jgi:glycosyltransferase involved in cell wall biosynthesis